MKGIYQLCDKSKLKDNQLFLVAQKLFNQKQFQDAVMLLLDLSRSNKPNIIKKGLNLIFNCYKKLSIEPLQIIRNLQQFYSRTNNNIEIALDIAEYCMLQKLYEKAQFWYSKIIQIDADCEQSWLKLIETYQRQQKFEQIIPTLQKYFLINQSFFSFDNLQTMLRMCQFCEQIENFSKAYFYYEYVIDIDPSNEEYYYKCVYCNLRSNSNMEICLTYIEQVLQITKEQDYRYCCFKGWILFKEGYKQEGIQLIKRSIRMNKSYEESHYYLALAYLNQKEVQSSLDIIIEYMKINPHSFRMQNLFAVSYWSYFSCQKFVNIIKEFSDRISSMQKLDGFLIHRILVHKGEFESALEYNRELLKNCKVQYQRINIYTRISELYIYIGNYQLALQFIMMKRNKYFLTSIEKTDLAAIYRNLGKIQHFQILMSELEQNYAIEKGTTVLIMRELEKIGQYQKCLDLYDTCLIVSQNKLTLNLRLSLWLILTKCHLHLHNVSKAIELILQIQSIVKDYTSFVRANIIVELVQVQIKLLNFDQVQKLYHLAKQQIIKWTSQDFYFDQKMLASRLQIIKKIINSNKQTPLGDL